VAADVGGQVGQGGVAVSGRAAGGVGVERFAQCVDEVGADDCLDRVIGGGLGRQGGVRKLDGKAGVPVASPGCGIGRTIVLPSRILST